LRTLSKTDAGRELNVHGVALLKALLYRPSKWRQQ